MLEEIKQTVRKETLLVYQNFNKRFDIHIDAKKYQIGAVIIQDDKPIDFHSHKLTGPQTMHTVTEK